MQLERVDFVSFLTQDMVRARRFYTEVLGLEIESEDESGNDMELTAGQVTLDIFEGKGVEFDGETLDTGVCHMAFFKDPDGNALMLHRRYAPKEKRGQG